MKQIDRDHYELSTGRRFHANCGTIGIAGDDNESEITGGYDDSLDMGLEWLEPDEVWTVAERQELADFMIARWTAWRDRQK